MSNTKKKILYVITKSNFGGAQRYVFELATEMQKRNFDVAVAFGGSGVLKEKLDQIGIRTYRIESFERDINLVKEVRSMVELATIIRKECPDIIHLNSSKAGGSGALVGRMLGVPRIIFTAHGWPFFEARGLLWRSTVWFLSWLTALLSHAVILVSNHDFNRTHMPFVKKKLAVIHTAVPNITFVSREVARESLFQKEIRVLHEHDTWLVSTSELTQNKNLLFALRAVETWNTTHAHKIFFTLIGDGELRGRLEAFITTHQLNNFVTCLGYVDNARTYLKAFDIFLLPSLKEGLPYGLLEAGAAPLACIASCIGGIPEVIEDGKTGLLINPNSLDSMLFALSKLVDLPEKQAEYATMLQRKITSTYSLPTMLEATEKLYRN